MFREIVSLYIDDTNLRLLVTNGNKIKKYADLPLEPGSVSNNVIIKESEVAARIQQLLKTQKIRTRKIMVGISGLHCLSRPIVFPQLPKEMLDEAVRREAKRALPLPIEQLYLSWQVMPSPVGQTQVFLVAIPCQIADPLFRVLRQARIKPYYLSLKPLLLARVANEATGIIVDLQATEFDIVVVSEGLPQPVRTIPFANESLSQQEKITMVRNDLDRTIAFYNSNNPSKKLTSDVPIFASGDLANDSNSCQALSQQSNHPVLPLLSSIEYPGGFDANHYMPNIGLTLSRLTPKKAVVSAIVNVNALPAPYRPKPVSLVNILTPPGIAIMAGLIVFLIMLIQSTSADITSLRTQINNAEQGYKQELSQKQEIAKIISALTKQAVDAEKSFRTLNAAMGSLETQTTNINKGLEATLSALPSTINLKAISYGDNILTISGHVPNEADLLLYLAELNASDGFGDITIQKMNRLESGEINFTLLGNPGKQIIGISDIETVINNLPPAIKLTGAAQTRVKLTVNGSAPDEDMLLLYLKSLETSGQFIEVVLTNMTRASSGQVEFTLDLYRGV